jgi:hypothetical protein
VFERNHVVALLRAEGGTSVDHPVAGVTGQLSLSELTCARSLVASALQRRQTAAAPAEVVVIDDEDCGEQATRSPRRGGPGTRNPAVPTPPPSHTAVPAKLGMRVRRIRESTGLVEEGTLVRIFHDGHALFKRSTVSDPRVLKQLLGALTCCSTGARLLLSNLPPRTRSLSIGQVATRYRMTGEPESLVVVENLHGNAVTVYVRETKAVYDERSPAWTLNIV